MSTFRGSRRHHLAALLAVIVLWSCAACGSSGSDPASAQPSGSRTKHATIRNPADAKGPLCRILTPSLAQSWNPKVNEVRAYKIPEINVCGYVRGNLEQLVNLVKTDLNGQPFQAYVDSFASQMMSTGQAVDLGDEGLFFPRGSTDSTSEIVWAHGDQAYETIVTPPVDTSARLVAFARKEDARIP